MKKQVQIINFGQRVCQMRKAYGDAWRKVPLTQSEFAARLGIPYEHISRMERGVNRSALLVLKISVFAHHAGCLTWLMTGEGKLTISPSAIRAEYKSIIGKETGNDMDVNPASSNK